MSKKNKWLIGAGVLVLILVVLGVYKNPDRKIGSAFDDYRKIIENESPRKKELATLMGQYKECFVPKDADISTYCIEGLPKIKILVSKEPRLLLSLQSLYENRKMI